MPSLTNLVVALAGASVASAVTPLSSIDLTKGARPTRFIVEFKPSADTSSFAKRDAHAEFFEHLDRRGVSWETNTKFDSELFQGVSMTLENPTDLAKVQALPSVASVHPVRIYPAPRTFHEKVITSATDPNLPKGDLSTTHIMTGVDKAHAQNIIGKGVKVGVIDTGVDYTHPNLGGGFGPGFLVEGGFDFVGDKFDSASPATAIPVPDNDPLDQCAGHGSHVSGIIAMQPGNEFNVSGVAYGAKLHVYRIFGCTGSTDDDVIMQALLRAYDDGCDVMNLSLGGPDGWVNGPGSVVASRIAAKGRGVAIAAGNEGAEGAWFTSSPGNGLDVISVGSVDNTEVFFQSLTVSGVTHDPIPYITGESIAPLNLTDSFPLFALSTDLTITNDACDALPDSTPDLSGFAVLIRRGTCNFSQKLANVEAKGAKLAIVLNNGGTFAPVVFGNTTVQAVIIDKPQGDFLVQQVIAKADIKIQFPQKGALSQLPAATGGLSSDFSTFGPTNDGYFKPALSGVGGNILATWPVKLGSWISISGTSMATPHVAGCLALLIGAKGRSPATVTSLRTLLQTTSTGIAADQTDGAPLNTLAQAGSGLVNVFNALTFKTKLSVGQFQLNDTTAPWKQQSFSIKNTGSKAVTYKISHIPAATLLTLDGTTGVPVPFPVPLSSDFATAKLSTSSVTVKAGQSTTVKVTFTPPTTANLKTVPVVSGHIQVQGGGEITKVAYLGIVTKLGTVASIDGSAGFFGTRIPLLLDASGNEQTGTGTYTLNGTDAPTVVFRLAFGSPRITFDLVDVNTHASVTNRPPTARVPAQKFTDIAIIGRIQEAHYVPRDSKDPNTGFQQLLLPPTFANGTTIAPGAYRLLLRVQHAATDPKLEGSHDVYLSNPVTITKAA